MITIQGDPGDFELVDTPLEEIAAFAFVRNVNGVRLFDGFASGHNIVFIFDLSQVSTELPLFEAGLGARLAEILTSTSFGFDPFDGDLYGVGFSSSPSILPPGLDFFSGPAPGPGGTDVLIQNNFVTASSPVGEFITTSTSGSLALANYINTSRPAGPEGDFLFLRINPDVIAFPEGEVAGYVFFSGNSDTPPILSVTFVPEPSTMALALLGAGLIGVTALRRARPSRRGDAAS